MFDNLNRQEQILQLLDAVERETRELLHRAETARDMLDVNRSFQDLRAAPGERAQRGVQQPAKACLQSRPCATDRPRARAAPPHPWK